MLMAYYPTFQPYGYQDQLNQLRNANQMQNPMPMQGFQQMPMQPQMPMQQPRQDQNGLIWVQGEAGAKSWFVNPGSTVLLMDSENQRFYLKSADMNGVPAMRTFAYSEVGAAKPQESTETVNFVTVDEFNGFRDEVFRKLEDLAEPMEVSVSRKGRKGNADE
jgi:hypothetical protein